MKIGTCLVCFDENVKVFDAGSQLQNAYEQITDFKVHDFSLYLCNICGTRLKQLSVLVKQIVDKKYIGHERIEVTHHPLVQLSTHVTEIGSIPYHLNFKQEFVIEIKKEDLIEENESNKPKTAVKKEKTKGLQKRKQRKSKTCIIKKSFACNICNKKYSRSDHLKLHKTCHTNDTPFACDLCKKKFKRKGNLTDHLKTHTNEKPHKCDVCSKTFLKGSNLRAHKLIHTREKPFSCDICNRTYKRKSHLTIHQRTHTGNKPYECDICKHTFSRSDHLRVHQKTHTRGNDIFICDVCQDVFIYKRHLKDHIFRTHCSKSK